MAKSLLAELQKRTNVGLKAAALLAEETAKKRDDDALAAKVKIEAEISQYIDCTLTAINLDADKGLSEYHRVIYSHSTIFTNRNIIVDRLRELGLYATAISISDTCYLIILW